MTAQQTSPAAPVTANGQPPRRGGITFLFMGPPKAGKSNLGDSGPQPRLVVDVEGETWWTASRKTEWNPQSPPPQPPALRLTAGYGEPSRTPEWETAVALVRKPADIARAYQVLNTGQHPWNSLSLDSVTEMQQRIIDHLVGMNPMQRDNWGALLRQSMWIVRQWRDLVNHPVKPLWTVTFVAGMTLDHNRGMYRPMLQGAGQDYIGYHVSLTGYLDVQPDETRLLYSRPIPPSWKPDGTLMRPGYETGERLGGRLPAVMPIAYEERPGWSLETMAAHALASR